MGVETVEAEMYVGGAVKSTNDYNTVKSDSMSPAEKATRNLNDAVGQVISAFDVLSERLRPVCVATEMKMNVPEPDVTSSILVSSINEEARRIYALVDRMRQTTQELEI